jgi:hypothetical protein
MTPTESRDHNLLSPFDPISPEPLSLKDTPDSKPLQFETAEYKDTSGSEKCSQCNKPLTGTYYMLNGRRTCSTCTELIKSNQLKTEGSFFRALIFGIGGAILGLILYSTFAIMTGWVIGYLSLAVGYIIAKVMMKGAGGIGGRKLQITAVLLTYSAVSLSAIPIWIHQIASDKGSEKSQIGTKPKSGDPSPNTNATTVVVPDKSDQPKGDDKHGLLSVLGYTLLLGLASPFLELGDGVGGIIGLVILFVGINIAWKMTKGVEVQILGPFGLKTKESP